MDQNSTKILSYLKEDVNRNGVVASKRMEPSPRPWKNPFSAIITHYSSSPTQELPATATEKRDNPPKKFQHIAWNTVYAYFENKSAIW